MNSKLLHQAGSKQICSWKITFGGGARWKEREVGLVGGGIDALDKFNTNLLLENYSLEVGTQGKKRSGWVGRGVRSKRSYLTYSSIIC